MLLGSSKPYIKISFLTGPTQQQVTDMPLVSPSASICLTICYCVPATASLPTSRSAGVTLSCRLLTMLR